MIQGFKKIADVQGNNTADLKLPDLENGVACEVDVALTTSPSLFDVDAPVGEYAAIEPTQLDLHLVSL
jgi:hypothetical protein